jgi:hypothetical protein
VLILGTPLYVNEQLKKNEIDFVLKKLGLSQIEFEELLKKPRIEHNSFGHKIPLLKRYPILKLLKPIKKLIVRS